MLQMKQRVEAAEAERESMRQEILHRDQQLRSQKFRHQGQIETLNGQLESLRRQNANLQSQVEHLERSRPTPTQPPPQMHHSGPETIQQRAIIDERANDVMRILREEMGSLREKLEGEKREVREKVRQNNGSFEFVNHNA